MIKIANAPCSWGALEFDLEAKSEEIGFEQVLDEIRDTGYLGTELGDWGFMPTDPSLLRKEIEQRELELLGAFVPVALARGEAHKEGIRRALRVAGLMYGAGYKGACIVLADDNGSVPERTLNAGRITSNIGLSENQWEVYASGAEKVARAVKEAYGLKTVFHHHCGGYVETPEEVATLMRLTDAKVLGLCLDTGHYTFAGGKPLEALKQYANRIWHVHFKDFDPEVAQRSRKANGDYFDAIKKGVFCELGKGVVDFQGIVDVLHENTYEGWIVVEQDILPGMGEPKKCARANRNFIKTLGL
ncbi:MAG: TIM barrel protein [Bacteroidota bacterium]